MLRRRKSRVEISAIAGRPCDALRRRGPPIAAISRGERRRRRQNMKRQLRRLSCILFAAQYWHWWRPAIASCIIRQLLSKYSKFYVRSTERNHFSGCCESINACVKLFETAARYVYNYSYQHHHGVILSQYQPPAAGELRRNQLLIEAKRPQAL